jgi:hypothetical protein
MDNGKIMKSTSQNTDLKTMLQAHQSRPAPVITRWETWFDATVQYAGNFEIFCCVVNELDRGVASSVAISQEILHDSLKV